MGWEFEYETEGMGPEYTDTGCAEDVKSVGRACTPSPLPRKVGWAWWPADNSYKSNGVGENQVSEQVQLFMPGEVAVSNKIPCDCFP